MQALSDDIFTSKFPTKNASIASLLICRVFILRICMFLGYEQLPQHSGALLLQYMGFAAGRNSNSEEERSHSGLQERKEAFLSAKTSSETGKAEQWLLRSLLIRKGRNKCGQKQESWGLFILPKTPKIDG